MKVYPNIFSNNPLDRASDLRSDQSWVKNCLNNKDAKICLFWKGKTFVSMHKNLTLANSLPGQLSPAWFPVEFFKNEITDDNLLIFLGLDNKVPFFAIDFSEIENLEDTFSLEKLGELEDLMVLAPQAINPGELAILGQARAIIEWNKSHKYCSKCGSKSIMIEAGYKRICNNCNAEHFPRTDPVVIMLATYKNTAFLGRQKRFPPGMYSALAGFVEPGESIEEAVARELMEEAGIEISSANYHSSQPWAFPNSLMIGYIAEAKNNNFKLDQLELDEGRWFSRDELHNSLTGSNENFFVPPPMAIAHHLIKAFIEHHK